MLGLLTQQFLLLKQIGIVLLFLTQEVGSVSFLHLLALTFDSVLNLVSDLVFDINKHLLCFFMLLVDSVNVLQVVTLGVVDSLLPISLEFPMSITKCLEVAVELLRCHIGNPS